MYNGKTWTCPEHLWGEEGFDWEGLGAAESYIYAKLTNLIPGATVITKEKYGTLRVTVYMEHTEENIRGYNEAYQDTIKIFPHLRDEILDDADYPEYITDYYINYAPGNSIEQETGPEASE